MIDIEKKALALVNDVADCRYEIDDFKEERRDTFKALCLAVEQHEWLRAEVKAQYHRGYYDGHNAARELCDE